MAIFWFCHNCLKDIEGQVPLTPKSFCEECKKKEISEEEPKKDN
jgi:hypothetical protein